MDPDAEKHFQLLLTEKELADSTISGYADLSLKVIGLFGAGLILLGWLYSEKGPADVTGGELSIAAGAVCCMLAVISCGIIVQGVSTYSLTLGYIQYKNEVLNVEFKRLLNLPEPPLKAVRSWASGAARSPVVLASVLLFILHKAIAVTLLLIAAYSFPARTWSICALVFAWVFLILTMVSELSLVRAMKRVLVDGIGPSA
jgi:hypothetical protein